MKHSILFKGLIAAALTLASGAALAEDVLAAPIPMSAPAGADPTAQYVTSTALTHAKVKIRELSQNSIQAATKFLKSADGKDWRVLEVKAPACGTKKGRECNRIKKDCSSAKKFVKKNGGHFLCSTLYQKTTVFLANDKQKSLPAAGE